MSTVNITCINDADFNRTFQYKTQSDNLPINITGWSLVMMLRRHAQDEVAVMRLATDTGEISLFDPVNGKFSVRIAQDELLRLGLGDFDQSLVGSNAGFKTSIWTGTLTNNPGPSR